MKQFFKLLKKELRLSAGYGVLALLFLVFTRFLTYYASLSDKVAWHAYGSYTRKQIMEYAVSQIGYARVSVITLCVLSGLLSLLICNYMHSKKRTDFYQSQPFTKTTVFAVKYLNGIIIFVLSHTVTVLLMVFGAAQLGAFNNEVALSAAKGFCLTLIAFVFLYSLFVCAGVLTANIITHFVLAAIFSFIIPAVYMLKTAWYQTFFTTFYNPVSDEAFLNTSPVWLVYKNGYNNSFKHFAVMAALAVLFTAVSFALAKIRPSESTEKALAFKCTIIPLRVFFSLMCGCTGGFILYQMFNSENSILLIAFFIVLTVLSSLIIQVIFFFDFSAVLKQKRWLLLSVGIAALISAATVASVNPYNTYVPSQNKIATLAVSIANIDNDETKFTEITPEEFFEENSYNNIPKAWLNTDSQRFFTREYDNNLILDRMNITDSALAVNTLTAFTSNLVNNVTDTDSERSYVIIKGTLTNGKTYYRSYIVNADNCKDTFTALVDNQEYKHGLWYSFYNLAPQNVKSVSVNGEYSFNKTDYLPLTDEQSKNLFNALQKDIESTTYQVLAESHPAASIGMFTANVTVSNAIQLKYTPDGIQGAEIFVYPTYTNTLAVLNELGYKFKTDEEVISDIDRIEIDFDETSNAYDYAVNTQTVQAEPVEEDYDNDTVTIYDKETISKLLPYIKPYVLSREYTYRGNFTIYAYKKDDPSDFDVVFLKTHPKNLPQELKELFN